MKKHIRNQILSSFIFIFGILLTGCATTDSTPKRTAADIVLPTPDMSDAYSCKEAGNSYYNKAWKMHEEDAQKNRDEILKLHVRSVELLGHSRNLLMRQDSNNENKESVVCLEMAWVCCSSKFFYPDEPQTCHMFYEIAIRHLTNHLEKYKASPPKKNASLEYELAYLHYLAGNADSAFLLADKAWGDGEHSRWNQEFWTWLKGYIVQNKIQTKNLPPLPPSKPLWDILLFPVNLIPDVLCDTVGYVVCSPFFIFRTLTSDEPGWAFSGIVLWPYGLVASSVFGFYDAWCGRPFWNTTIIQLMMGKKGDHEYFYDKAPD